MNTQERIWEWKHSICVYHKWCLNVKDCNKGRKMISPPDGNIYLNFSFSFLGPRDVDESFSTHTLFFECCCNEFNLSKPINRYLSFDLSNSLSPLREQCPRPPPPHAHTQTHSHTQRHGCISKSQKQQWMKAMQSQTESDNNTHINYPLIDTAGQSVTHLMNC